MNKEFYTPKDIAELLGIGYATALQWIKYDSGIPYIKVGRTYRVKVDVFDKFTSTAPNEK